MALFLSIMIATLVESALAGFIFALSPFESESVRSYCRETLLDHAKLYQVAAILRTKVFLKGRKPW